MEQLEPVLKDLTRSRKLCPAEQIILHKIMQFEETWPQELSDEDFSKIEAYLINILLVNDGTLSMACSISIAKYFMRLYTGERVKKVSNLIDAVMDRPYQSLIFAAGFAIDKIGNEVKDKVVRLVERLVSLVGQTSTVIISALYALCACFTVARYETAVCIDKTLLFIRRAIAMPDDGTTIMALKLMRSMLKFGNTVIPSLTQVLREVVDGQPSAHVTDEISHFIANMALMTLHDRRNSMIERADSEISESSVSDSGSIAKAFATLREFHGFYHLSLGKFISSLTLEYIHNNLDFLYENIRSKCVDDLPCLLGFLSAEDKRHLYEKVILEAVSGDMLYVMRLLASDDVTLKETASLALQLITRQNPSLRNTSSSFFAYLTKENQNLAKGFLKTAATYLNSPSETNRINREIKGMTIIICEILEQAPKLAETVRDLLVEYIPTALKMNIWEGHFHSAFMLMTLLPEDYYSIEEAEVAIRRFLAFITTGVIVTDAMINKIILNTSSILMFLTKHPDVECASEFVKEVVSIDDIDNFAVNTPVLMLLPKLIMHEEHVEVIATKVREIIKGTAAPQDYIRSMMENPIKEMKQIMRGVNDYVAQDTKVVSQIQQTLFAQKCSQMYPDFLLALPTEMGRKYAEQFCSQEINYPAGPGNLLALLQRPNVWSLLPEDLHTQILAYLGQSNQGVFRWSVFAECLGIWVQAHPDIATKVAKQIVAMKPSIQKCFAYSGMMLKCQFDDDSYTEYFLVETMQELNMMAMKPETSVYALYALGVLYDKHMRQLSNMPVTDGQASFFVNFLNSEMALDPYNLFYAAQAFVSLLAIVSPELQGERKYLVTDLKIAVRAFCHIRISFSKEIYDNVLKAVFALARFLAPPEPLVFPISRDVSFQTKLSSCGLLSYFINMTDTPDDFFGVLPEVLKLLHLTGDQRTSELIYAMMSEFTRSAAGKESTENVRKRAVEWTQLIKLCAASRQLPETGEVIITPSENVRKSMMSSANLILPVIAKSEPLMKDCLDDIMVSAISCLESRNADLLNETFNCLATVISTFGEVKENDVCILAAYEKQLSDILRVGFTHLSKSGPLMHQCLVFHRERIKYDPESILNLVDVFMDGLSEASDKANHYLPIAAQIAVTAKLCDAISEKIAPFTSVFCTRLGSIVKEALTLWTAEEKQWNEIAQFRINYGKYYSDIVVAFVWLQVYTKETLIPREQLQQFFEEEIKNGTENWRVVAAMEGLATIMELYSSEMSDNTLIDVFKMLNESDKVFSSFALPGFIATFAERVSNNAKVWETILGFIEKFNAGNKKSLAYLLNNDNGLLGKHVPQFLALIQKQNTKDALALATILLEKAPGEASNMLQKVLDSKTSTTEFKAGFIFKCFKVGKNVVKKETVLKFAFDHLFNGGLEIIVDMINDDSFDATESAEFREIFQGTWTTTETVRILELAVVTATKYETEGNALFNLLIKFVFSAALKHKTSEITTYCSQALHICKNNHAAVLKNQFMELEKQEQQEIVKLVESLFNESNASEAPRAENPEDDN